MYYSTSLICSVHNPDGRTPFGPVPFCDILAAVAPPVLLVPLVLLDPSGVRGHPPVVVRSAPRRQRRGRCLAVRANLPAQPTLLWLRTI